MVYLVLMAALVLVASTLVLSSCMLASYVEGVVEAEGQELVFSDTLASDSVRYQAEVIHRSAESHGSKELAASL